MKILISSHVSFHKSSQHDGPSTSVANRVAGQPEEHVLERRQHRPEVGDRGSVLGEAAGSRG